MQPGNNLYPHMRGASGAGFMGQPSPFGQGASVGGGAPQAMPFEPTNPSHLFPQQFVLNTGWGGQPRMEHSGMYGMQPSLTGGPTAGQMTQGYAMNPHREYYDARLRGDLQYTGVRPIMNGSAAPMVGIADSRRYPQDAIVDGGRLWGKDSVDYSRPERFDPQRSSPSQRRERDYNSRESGKDNHRDYRRERDYERDRSRERTRQRDKDREKDREKEREKRDGRGTPKKASRSQSVSKSNPTAEDVKGSLDETPHVGSDIKDNPMCADIAPSATVENRESAKSDNGLYSKDLEQTSGVMNDVEKQDNFESLAEEIECNETPQQTPSERIRNLVTPASELDKNPVGINIVSPEQSSIKFGVTKEAENSATGQPSSDVQESAHRTQLIAQEMINGQREDSRERVSNMEQTVDTTNIIAPFYAPSQEEIASYDLEELKKIYEQSRKHQEHLELEYFRLRQNLLESCIMKEELQKTAEAIRAQLHDFKAIVAEKQQHKKSLEEKLTPLERELEQLRKTVIEKKIGSAHHRLAERLSQQDQQHQHQQDSALSIAINQSLIRNTDSLNRRLSTDKNATN